MLGDACALVSTFVSKTVESILVAHPCVIDLQKVFSHSWKCVITMLEFCNQIAKLHSGSFMMFPQYWGSDHRAKTSRTKEMIFSAPTNAYTQRRGSCSLQFRLVCMRFVVTDDLRASKSSTPHACWQRPGLLWLGKRVSAA